MLVVLVLCSFAIVTVWYTCFGCFVGLGLSLSFVVCWGYGASVCGVGVLCVFDDFYFH